MAVTLLDPNTQTKFVNEFTAPPVLDATAGGSYAIQANEIDDYAFGLTDPTTGAPLYSSVFSYQMLDSNGRPVGGGLFGPTIVASSGVPAKIAWANNLPPLDASKLLLPIDNTIHKADPTGGFTPIVTHLHGGHTSSASDGYPDSWYTSDDQTGMTFTGIDYTYANTQQAATLIYHDHALGYTSQNVYAGLGGFYLIRDANLNKLMEKGVLPTGAYEVGAVLQDRAFSDTGQIYMPGGALSDPIPGTGETVGELVPGWPDNTPTALPEFFGDFLTVNGVAWPKMTVGKGEVLLHFANISDSRFYDMYVSDPNVKITLVGTDGGLLKNAIVINDGDGIAEAGEDVILAPGDRVDLVFDFTNAKGDVTLHNQGPEYEPFKGLGSYADGVTTAQPGDAVGDIMQFAVDDAQAAFHSKLFSNTADLTPNQVLNPSYKPLREASADKVRKVGLYETTDEYGRTLPLLGTAENTIDINGDVVKAGALGWMAPITEAPLKNSTEVWEIFNYTADAHPIHLHQVQYQVLGRYNMLQTDINGDGVVDQADYQAVNDANGDGLVNDLGAATPLRPEDAGWQDTVWVGPGQALKIIQKFDLPGDYVWHCHILSHENNEMMRPMHVINTIDGGSGRDRLKGTDDIDSITCGAGNDIAYGLGGDDRFVATNWDGNDTYDGGEGSDTLDLSQTSGRTLVNLGTTADWSARPTSRVAALNGELTGLAGASLTKSGFAVGCQIGVDKLTSIENVIGSCKDDYIVGSAGGNKLTGGAGDDYIDGRAGDDTIWGQAGDDILKGGDGADTFLYYRDLVTNKIDIGRDAILDFNAGQDHVAIDTGIYADFASLAAHLRDTAAGAVLSFDASAQNSVTFQTVTVAQLTQAQQQTQCFKFV